MRDFSLKAYNFLITGLITEKYRICTLENYLQKGVGDIKTVVLRHDVDKRPKIALRLAELENKSDVRGSYYFRVNKDKLPKNEITGIAKLGHEIGYHYEDLVAQHGDLDKALVSFAENLARLRELAPVRTACMHGSPLSRHDNRAMWKSISYHEFGIIGEPYFDVDFSKVLYLTDTGRRWNGDKFSVRDRVGPGNSLSCHFNFYHTQEIISAISAGKIPSKVMLTIHPQRWTDDWIPWTIELMGQKIKNVVKYFVVKGNDSRK